MLQRSTCCLEQISGIVLVGTAHPMTFHLPINTTSQPSRASHGTTHRWNISDFASLFVASGAWLSETMCFYIAIPLQYLARNLEEFFKAGSCWSIVNAHVFTERVCVTPCWNQQIQISPNLFCFRGSHYQGPIHWLPAEFFMNAQHNGVTEHGTFWWTLINVQTNFFYHSQASMKRWQLNEDLKCLFQFNSCGFINLINFENKYNAGNISSYDVVLNKNWKFRKP